VVISVGKKGVGAFRCSRCGAVTWGNLDHCMDCGQALNIECDECGATWRYFYEYAYCPSCGARVKNKKKERI